MHFPVEFGGSKKSNEFSIMQNILVHQVTVHTEPVIDFTELCVPC